MPIDYLLIKRQYKTNKRQWELKKTQNHFNTQCNARAGYLLKQRRTPVKRSKMTKSSSSKSFKKGMKTNTKNLAPAPTRGGYRF